MVSMRISICTTMTNPEERMDPWKEATDCYKDFSDEIIDSVTLNNTSVDVILYLLSISKSVFP